MGFGSFLKKAIGAAGSSTGLGILGGVAGGLGSFMQGRAADKAAKADAANQNASNKWKYTLDRATYGTEKVPTLKRAQRSSALRRQLQAAIMSNPKYGLSTLLPGFAQLQQSYAPKDIVNPYDAAGAPPEMKATTMGFGGNLLSGLAGAGSGAIQGVIAGKK